ncbi:PhnA domain-containing protein [Bacillus sp. FJAT-53711]|uniref:PhnA domain-containing protein n=1 Tax=Bacillus yunxiaonensis TaxID=3127665 RepID=A0ABU8FY21_9BACI
MWVCRSGCQEARYNDYSYGNTGFTKYQRENNELKRKSISYKNRYKSKNIRLVERDHDIDCKIDGIGAMQLISEFVKNV